MKAVAWICAILIAFPSITSALDCYSCYHEENDHGEIPQPNCNNHPEKVNVSTCTLENSLYFEIFTSSYNGTADKNLGRFRTFQQGKYNNSGQGILQEEEPNVFRCAKVMVDIVDYGKAIARDCIVITTAQQDIKCTENFKIGDGYEATSKLLCLCDKDKCNSATAQNSITILVTFLVFSCIKLLN